MTGGRSAAWPSYITDVAKLKSIFPKWMLKERSYGELELGGSGAQVFEVEDLPVPEGTDWSGLGYALGTLDLPFGWGSWITCKLFIELDAAIPAGNELFLSVDDDPDFSVSSTLMRARVLSPQIWKVGTVVGNAAGDLLVSDGSSPESNNISFTGPEAPLPVLPDTLYVALHTSGPTDADITVVQARAVFHVD